MKKRPTFKNRLADDLQEIWRPSADFIGPLMPPMLLWFARGRPKSQWAIDAERRQFARHARQPDLFEAAGR